MYKRYDMEDNRVKGGDSKENARQTVYKRENIRKEAVKNENIKKEQPKRNKSNPILGFIPRSIYNPDTGKILGILSADDLLIIALIILLIDNEDECEDNKLLIYALVYILISDYIDIPI